MPTVLAAIGSRLALAFAVLEAAILAIATAYAVYLGVYRYEPVRRRRSLEKDAPRR